VEQAAFSPSTMVPGIAPSADPMLQARMFSYPDAARYRLGANYQFLPTNAARSPVYSPFERDGFSNVCGNYGGDPNYVRSTLRPMNYGPQTVAHDTWVGKVVAYSSEITDDDFLQPKGMWEVFRRTGQQENFVRNLAGHLKEALPEVQEETISKFKHEINSLLIIVQRYLLGWMKIWRSGLRKLCCLKRMEIKLGQKL
jgi:catalase